MTTETIQIVQDYLTVIRGGSKKQIIDIETLLNRHPAQAIIWFLRTLYKEKKIKLRDLLERDKTSPEINETIAAMFRIYMAICTMQEEREVKAA